MVNVQDLEDMGAVKSDRSKGKLYVVAILIERAKLEH